MRAIRPAAAAAAAALATGALLVSGCGSGGDDGAPPASEPQLLDPGAAEASPEAPAPGAGAPEGELTEGDREAVANAVYSYVAALNRGHGAAVCALLTPGAVPLRELPRRGAGCGGSVSASLGFERPGGTPAWKRTKVRELSSVAVAEDTARVTATVTHDFADRRFTSLEEDVIYLRRAGDAWLLAKPSGTFYRAVGYPEPPLRALTPP